MTENINLSSKYSVEEYIHKKIAPKYLNLDDATNYRVGVYGYINELFSTGISISSHALSELFGEVFPNTARLSESIMKYASLAKVDGLYAKPANMNVIIAIEEDYIINRSRWTNGVTLDKIRIPKELVVDVEGFKFTLEDDIVITYKMVDGQYAYAAYYDKNGETSDNPYIKVLKIKQYDRNAIYIYPTIKQMTRSVTTRYIMSTNMLDNISHIVTFDGQLADFNVYYKKSNSTEIEKVEKFIEGSSNIVSNTKSCFYRVISDSELEIQFESRSGFFKPEFNSELIIEVFTSKGSKGNFTYSGSDIVVKYPNEEDESLPMTIVPVTDSVLGSDKLSLEEIRKKVCDTFSMRDTIVMDSDLYKHYNSYNLSGADKSKLRFIKYRDDVFKRMYMAYILLRDKNGEVIPSNSIDIGIKPSEYNYETNISYIYKSNNRMIYDPSINAVVPYRAELDTPEDAGFNYIFKYRNPYLIVTTKKPNMSIALIDYINDTYQNVYSYINPDSIMQFICNNFKVFRNPDIDERHRITMSVQKNIVPYEVDLATKDEEGNITDLGIIKMYLTVYHKNVCLGYIPLTMFDVDIEKGIYHFEGYINTSHEMYSDSVISKDTFYKPFVNTDEIIDVKLPYTDLYFKTTIFSRQDILYNRAEVNEINVPYGYSLVNIYHNTEDSPVDIFHNVSDIIQLEMKNMIIDRTDRTTYNRIIKAPLIAEYYYDDIQHKEYVHKTLFEKRNLFKIAGTKIVENYSIMLKLYNTYGPSLYYNIGRADRVDRVNLSMTFNIRLTKTSILTKLEIAKAIKAYVENLNNADMSPLYISKLIDHMQSTYQDIMFMEFQNINKYVSNYQAIEPVNVGNLEAGFVPEFINIHNRLEYGQYVPDININIV